jgi:hypothetical protein
MKLGYLLILLLLCLFAVNVSAQTDKSSIEVYGFVMTDAGYNVKTINPDWYDAIKPSKLPSFEGEFAPDGKVFFSVRQSRFGVSSSTPTALGLFTTKLEIDLFGVGDRVGQTDLRLRHAWGQLGHFAAGQMNSAFMDIDVFPNTVEYWGPNGMLFLRNIQVRYIPLMDKKNDLTFAVENPGGSADGGDYAQRFDLQSVKPKLGLPDFSAHYRYTDNWGYVQVGGIVGQLKWEDTNDSAQYSLSGDAIRWGASISSNINVGKKAIIRVQGTYGEGIQNYFNDAPYDVATKVDTTNTVSPIKGVALPIWGISAFADIYWNKKFSTTLGYSVATIKNTNGQSANAYKQGQYMAANIMYYPVNNIMAGVEFLFARRDNNKDGFHSTLPQIRFAFKYNFSKVFTF